MHSCRPPLKIALLEAAGRGELGADPDKVLEILAPAVAELDARTADLLAEVAAVRQELANERADRSAERRDLVKLRLRAENDAVAALSAVQPDVLRNPWGFYVYFLRDHAGEILYVGLSTNILQRLGKHMSVRGRASAIASISVMECKDEAAMRRREIAAIRKHQPPWNILGIVA